MGSEVKSLSAHFMNHRGYLLCARTKEQNEMNKIKKEEEEEEGILCRLFE